MTTEVLTLQVENAFPITSSIPPLFPTIPPLESETAGVIDTVERVITQYQNEGDAMFVTQEAKVGCYVGLRNMTRNIPRYTNAIDVRDTNAIPNRLSGRLDNAFATLHELWSQDPLIQKRLEEERSEFEKKYREWYGTRDEAGVRDRMFSGFTTNPEQEARVSEREFEALEMKARRAYCLPTMTTASESPV